ncbi:MAG: DUF255 domain-containing protein [Ekhidna sp.]|nr:DUF255 domain-containing protein [Ekhidna sp.]
MKKLILVICLFPALLFAQIGFESAELSELILKSRKEGKLIFLNTYTEWCEPCQEMSEYTFADLEVANFYNSKFINVQMDMEAYPGLEVAEEFKVAVFPTFLFLDGNGNIVHRGCGSMDATEFLNLGEDVLAGKGLLSEKESLYDAGERSTDFLLDYFATLEIVCLDAEKEAKRYLENVDLADLFKETPWEIFASYNWDIYSREFQYLMKHKEVFDETIGRKLVDAKLYDTFLSQYQEVFETEELHDFGMRSLLHSIKDVAFVGSDTLQAMMNLHYSEYAEDWISYAENAISLVGMSGLDDPEQLNDLAWKFYLFVDNKNQLEIASTWAKQAVDIQPEPSWIDTYASLQFKLGNRMKAIELEKKALELAIELNDDPAHYQYQLKKFSQK